MSAQYDRIDHNEESSTIMQRFLDTLNLNRSQTLVNHSNDNETGSICSTGSTYSENFQLKKEIWKKKKIILIVTGTIIVSIIFFIALLILEPWK